MAEHSSAPTQRRYPPELRERAVRMVLETASERGERLAAVTRVANQLGIGPKSLRNWVLQAEVYDGKRTGLTAEARAHMRDLERDVRELRLRAQGWRLVGIARESGCTAPMVGFMVRDDEPGHGRPVGRHPRRGCLTISERQQVLLGIGRRESLRAITQRTSHAPSTIARASRASGGRERYSS